MLPHKFKLIGLLLAILSLTVFTGRLVYLVKMPPVTHTIKGDLPRAQQIEDSVNAYNYSKITTQTVDESGKVIKSVTQTTGTSDLNDPVLFIAGLLIIVGILAGALAKEKVEDERIDKIRLIAFRQSFITGIIMGTVLFSLDYYEIKVPIYTLIMAMLAVYFVVFYNLKKRDVVS